jgi:transposase
VSVDVASFAHFFRNAISEGAHLSIMQRTVITTLHHLGFADAYISQLTLCGLASIRRWIDHFDHHGDLQDEPRTGRPRITDFDTDTSIAGIAMQNPTTTPRLIRSELGIDASARTVRRRLDEAGLFGRVARIEFPLTEEHIRKRLAFAHAYGGWSPEDWDRVMFSDDSYIYLGHHGQTWVQRPEDTAYLEQYMVLGQRQFSPKIGMWGCFSSQGVGSMSLFHENMDTRLYTYYMARHMKPHALRTWPNAGWFYLQDNASYHGAAASRRWFHNNGVTCIEFPPHSPDLNPIENLWAHLKRRIEDHNARSIEELKEIISEEWAEISADFCARLTHSMPHRLQLVVEAGGHRTRY